MQQYNPKIYIDGSYKPFYGWTIVCPTVTDFKFIENYIKENNFIKKYVSPLPSSSYHVTVFSIWSNLCNLIPQQIQNLNTFELKILEQKSKSGYFNPNNCIDNFLYQLFFECKRSSIKFLTLKIKLVYFNKQNIGIIFHDSDDLVKLQNLRNKIINVSKYTDGMDTFHMTLGYTFKDIDTKTEQSINEELNILNIILKNQTVVFRCPDVCSFESMEKFTPISLTLNP